MKLTKIFYGNQYVESFVVGKKKSKLSKPRRLLLKTAKLCILAWLIVGGIKVGQHLTPVNTVFAEKEVIVEKTLKFEDIPILVKICNAESGGRQFLKNGNVVRGIVNRSDIGFCQINETINNDDARRLGYDIYTEKGNKDYAIHLFLTRGTQPWNASKDNWNK